MSNGMNPLDIWNYKMGSMVSQMARVHCIYSIAKIALKKLKEVENPKLGEVFIDVFRYFLYNEIKEYASQIMESEIITAAHLSVIQ